MPASRLLKSCAMPPGELAHRLHLLRLTQRRLRLGERLLPEPPLGHVVDDLVGADALAAFVAQGIELDLVAAPGQGRIAELLDDRELLAGKRAAPHGPDRRLVLGAVGEEVEHAVPDPRADAEDPFELVRGGLVDGEPAVITVGDLDEGVGGLDDAGSG